MIGMQDRRESKTSKRSKNNRTEPRRIRQETMKYSGRILLVVLFASLAVMVAKSVPTPVTGTLKIYVRNGVGLPDRDGLHAGNSDPYVKVTAYRQSGDPVTLNTDHDQGDESPEWYEWLNFGNDYWTHFTVNVYDRDVGGDDSLSGMSTYNLNGYITGTYVTMNCDSGYITFDYYFQQ